MNIHQITLQGYTASVVPSTDPTSNCVSGLYLGTAGSYGVEQLDVTQSTGWENLSVTAIFQPCGVKITVPAEGGTIDVPWEATADMLTYPQGRIVFQGYADGELVNSCDLPYTVSGHSATTGTDPQPPTPDQYQQFVQEVQASADAAANSATAAAGSASAAAGSASAAAGRAQQAAETLWQVQEAGQQATEAIGTAQTNAVQVVGGAQSAAVQAVQSAQSDGVQAVQDQQQMSVGAVQAAGTEAVGQVTQTGQQQVQAVKDEGTAQIGAVAEAGSAQVQAVNSAGDTKLDQINTAIAHPPQPNTSTGFWQIWNTEAGKYEDTTALYQGGYYTPSVAAGGTLTWTGSQSGMPELPSTNISGPQGLGVPTPSASNIGQVPTVNDAGDGYLLTGPYAPLEASIRPTANGNPAVCSDSVVWSFQGLKVYGKSTQDGAPSPDNPVPIISAGDGGSAELSITGKNLISESELLDENNPNYEKFDPYSFWVLKKFVGFQPCTLSVGQVSKSDGYLAFNNKPTTVGVGGWIAHPSVRLVPRVTETPDENGYVYIIVSNTLALIQSMLDGVGYIQLEIGSTATAYEPYTSRSLIISTPSGLPGIPAESGGNYTDASGQQWLCNYRDYGRGVDVGGNVNTIIFDGSSDESLYRASPGFQTEPVFVFYIPTDIWVANNIDCLSNQYVAQTVLNSGNILQNGYMWTRSEYFGKAIAVRNDAIASESEMRAFLQSNPLVFVLNGNGNVTETPIPAEELAAYRSLQTYPGTTVVSTAEPVAGIEAQYIMDGTAAWNKITGALAQLSAANTQTSQVVNTMLGAE